jgi:spore maturation protein CgeD
LEETRVAFGNAVKGWVGLENLNLHADVAVTLASFNRPVMVEKAIRSVLEQTYDNWNLYVMDNNSVDAVKDVLLKYQHTPRIALYFSNTQAHERLDKYWLGAMLNIGVQQGKESFVASLTDDCYMLPQSLAVKAEYLCEHPEAAVCFGGQYLVNVKGELQGIRNSYPRDYPILKGACVVDLCQIMVRRTFLEQVGLWNEDINRKPYPWIDASLFEKAETLGDKLYSVGKRTDVFVEHGKSQMTYLLSGKRSEL